EPVAVSVQQVEVGEPEVAKGWRQLLKVDEAAAMKVHVRAQDEESAQKAGGRCGHDHERGTQPGADDDRRGRQPGDNDVRDRIALAAEERRAHGDTDDSTQESAVDGDKQVHTHDRLLSRTEGPSCSKMIPQPGAYLARPAPRLVRAGLVPVPSRPHPWLRG